MNGTYVNKSKKRKRIPIEKVCTRIRNDLWEQANKQIKLIVVFQVIGVMGSVNGMHELKNQLHNNNRYIAGHL